VLEQGTNKGGAERPAGRQGGPYESLAAWTYSDPDFFELEKESLFLTSWQLVCHTSNIPNIGDYFTFDFLGEQIVTIRTKGDHIKSFHNVCRHRASRLLDGVVGTCSGKNKDRIVCPYHAWTYNTDGDLTGMPYRDQFKHAEPSQLGLKSVDQEIFQGFIFIRVQPDGGPSVADQFVDVIEELKPYRLEELQPLSRVTLRPRSVNWKQIADNYVDALHIPTAHPGLGGLMGNSYGLEVRGPIHKMWGDLRTTRKSGLSNELYQSILPDFDHLLGANKRRWVYYRMWPNLALDIYPEQLDFMQFIPVSSTETMIREMPYALPDERREVKLAQYLNWRINRQVNAEDTELIKGVQAGMSGSSYSVGPLADTEVCLLDSAQRMHHQIPVSKLVNHPGRGEVFKTNDLMKTGAC